MIFIKIGYLKLVSSESRAFLFVIIYTVIIFVNISLEIRLIKLDPLLVAYFNILFCTLFWFS